MKKASKPGKKGGDVKRKSMTAQMLSADMAAAAALADISADSISTDSIQEESAEVPAQCSLAGLRFPQRSLNHRLLRGAAA